MSSFLTVKRVIALFDHAGGSATEFIAKIGNAIGDLSNQQKIGNTLWSNVSFLEAGDPAPTGWMPEEFLDRNFTPEIDPEIDRQTFVEDCLLAAWNSGANTHFLAAWAQFESGIKNEVVTIGDDDLIGPFRFSVDTWDALRNSSDFNVAYETTRIYRPDCQCDVAGVATRKAIDAFKIANSDTAPRANELLLALRIGVPCAIAAVRAKSTALIKDVIDGVFAEIDAANAAHRSDRIFSLNADILLDVPGGGPVTVENLFERINARLQGALTTVRPLIGAIDPELVPTPQSSTEGNPGVTSLRYSGEVDDQQVYGHLILRMQQALTNFLTTVDKDMSFGPETAGALNVWHAKNGRPGTNKITGRQWSDLTKLPIPTLRDYCYQITASFEGHGFNEKVIGDEDGAILTWGYNGFTFRWGHVQEIIRSADKANQEWLTDSFGKEAADEFRAILKMPLVPEQLAWGRQNLVGADKAVKPEWEERFKKLGAIEGVRAAQLQHCEVIWNDTMKIIAARNFSQRLTIALCYDIVVQNGPGKLKELLVGINGALAEEQVRGRLVGGLSGASQKRKAIIAAGEGAKLPGDKFYRLDDWGLLGEEEDESGQTETGVAAGSIDATFGDFIMRAVPEIGGLFKPEEFFVKGSNVSGLNTNPPRRFWANIVSTAKVIAQFRSALPSGHRVIFNSVYRSPAYNKQIGGAKSSQHMRFNAIDFRVEGANPGSPAQWAKMLRAMRAAGVFRGGVGLYNTFVHLDTRGSNVDF
ncbi:DUF882 domain-containing protein [Rhizobium leguminosarum]|uniref:YcbK family protein n=1 Tax=Rhizobium leguminosarum TaxID=384 RepID=UPI0013D8EC8C|nr:D-Ala-D-Ala carboxypeptidase family metallohydrolase [Rhizobium leguminosarum]NEH49585.1 DUF882 domain-containing protein [Rhizobium leguminosarum]